MILAELRIENYKQFLGEHRIEPPQAGIVAVIGANGVGKTTLFEAIEWCLYNPATIVNADVPPRGGVGQTRVAVVLEDTRDGVRYVVERTLKRKVATGEIYREDRPTEPIVQGSRQVTDYVARKLVGLGHRAFVSTFFTRQKELSFFGSLKETERRVEVGRLLGLETIRDAQKAIGEERSRAQAEARGLKLQYDEQAAGRDFPAEIGGAEAAIAVQETATADAGARLAVATEAHTSARAELVRWQGLERRDAALAQALERIGGDERAATARRNAAADALRRLDEAAAARTALLPRAAAEAERALAVAGHDAERERASRANLARRDLSRADRDRTAAVAGMQREIEHVGPEGSRFDGWVWSSRDDADPVAAATRRAAIVEDLDVEEACETAVRLVRGAALVAERDRTRAKATKWGGAFRAIQAERAAFLRDGDPAEIAAHAAAAREAALKTAQAAETEAKAVVAERGRLEPIVRGLRAQRFDDECPTCGRAFSGHEAGVVLATLERRLAALDAEKQRLGDERTAAAAAAAAAEQAQRGAAERLRDLALFDGRIREGAPKVDEAEADAAEAARACAAELAAQGLNEDPTPESVRRAEAHAALLTRLANAIPLLGRLGQDARRAADDAAEAHRLLTELGPVAYDAEAHAAAGRALKEATDAAARVGQIDDELARRPGHEAERAAAAADLERLAADRARVATERGALGFDPAALAHAEEAERAALAAEREAARAQNAAQTALREEIGRRDALLAEQGRVAALALRAETRGREADELERMYREFTRFDQYVAGRVTPQLAEHTGELLGAITQGKYDRVAFDENYGLTLYDEDETFPVEAFSGGERDVAALAARLALSRLVGGQAAHPPSFLVLDEVFGSLDADRRAQVLATLGTLAAGTEAFRQLFIISHVEDVQLSAIFDEVWQVSEVDGVSRFANLTRAGGLAEL